MCFTPRAERERGFGPADVFASQMDDIEEFSSSLPPRSSSSSSASSFEIVTDEYMLEIMGRARQEAAINVMSDTCKRGNTYPAQPVVIDKFKTTSALVDHLEEMAHWKSSLKCFAHVAKYGTITQAQATAYGATHAFDSLEKGNVNILATKSGIYCHLTTRQHKITGEIITTIYVGSAQAQLLAEDAKTEGICIRVRGYSRHDQRWREKCWNKSDEMAEKWRKKKEELREHGDTWPDDDDEYVVLHHTWWVAMAQTKVEHFTSLCGGDKEAGKKLLALYMTAKEDLEDVRTLSRAWVHFLEGFVMLMSGMAPTYESSQRQQTPNPILKQHKKNTKNLWLKPPTGYTFMPINCHLTMYEGRGQHPNMSLEAAAKWTEKYRTLNKAPRTLGDIERWLRVRNSFHSMPSDSGSYREIGLPDLTGTIHAGNVQPAIKNWLSKFDFDEEGVSDMMDVDKDGLLLPTNNSVWLKTAVHIFLKHEHPLSANDHTQFARKANPPSVRSTNLLAPTKFRSSMYAVQVELTQIDELALPKADMTGIVVRIYRKARDQQNNRVWQEEKEIQREHGEYDPDLHDDYTFLERIVAILRISIACARKVDGLYRLSSFFEKRPDAIQELDEVPEEPTARPIDPALLERGRKEVERMQKKLQGWQVPELDQTFFALYGLMGGEDEEQLGRVMLHQGYLLIPYLPGQEDVGLYAQSLVVDGIYEHPHGDGELRLVTPVGSCTWATNMDLGRRLGSAWTLHRAIGRTAFFLIFLRSGESDTVPVEILDWVLDQADNLDGSPVEQYVGNWLVQARLVSHRYPGTRAYFQERDYEEKLVAVLYMSSTSRNNSFGHVPFKQFDRISNTFDRVIEDVEILRGPAAIEALGYELGRSSELINVDAGSQVGYPIEPLDMEVLYWSLYEAAIVVPDLGNWDDLVALYSLAQTQDQHWSRETSLEEIFTLIELLGRCPWVELTLRVVDWRTGLRLFQLGNEAAMNPDGYFWEAVQTIREGRFLICSRESLVEVKIVNGRIRKEYEIDTIHHVRVYPSEDGPGQSNLTLHQTATLDEQAGKWVYDPESDDPEQMERWELKASPISVRKIAVHWIADVRIDNTALASRESKRQLLKQLDPDLPLTQSSQSQDPESLERYQAAPFRQRKRAKTTRSPSAVPTLVDEKAGIFLMEKVVDARVVQGGKMEFLIKWEGFSNTASTWEPLTSIPGGEANSTLQEYFARNRNKVVRLYQQQQALTEEADEE